MPMLPRSYGLLDIEIAQGSDFRYALTLKDRSGNVLNLEGWTARMQGRELDDTLIFSLTDGNGIEMDLAENKVRIVMLASLTETFDFTKGRYDIELFNIAANETRRVLAGALTLSREATV